MLSPDPLASDLGKSLPLRAFISASVKWGVVRMSCRLHEFWCIPTPPGGSLRLGAEGVGSSIELLGLGGESQVLATGWSSSIFRFIISCNQGAVSREAVLGALLFASVNGSQSPCCFCPEPMGPAPTQDV